MRTSAGGMAGMIIGVTDRPGRPAAERSRRSDQRGRRDLISSRWRETLSAGRSLSSASRCRRPHPGARGLHASRRPVRHSCCGADEPVEITVVNHLGEATALHWHGMELDSYYDGVHGWSGINADSGADDRGQEASFVVRFTPPRTGTFMYHTHLHDERQLPLGLYGPMVVVDPDETFDPETDHVLMVARRGLDPAAPNVLVSGDAGRPERRHRAAVRVEGRRSVTVCG